MYEIYSSSKGFDVCKRVNRNIVERDSVTKAIKVMQVEELIPQTNSPFKTEKEAKTFLFELMGINPTYVDDDDPDIENALIELGRLRNGN
jgi:hypothetical protein